MPTSNSNDDIAPFDLTDALWDSYEKTGELSELDRAISILRKNVSEAQYSRRYASALSNLGAALIRLWDRTGDLTSLNEAISALEMAAASSSASNTPAYANLGAALARRYEISEEMPDLDRAISIFQEIVNFGIGRPDSAATFNLGAALLTRATRSGLSLDLDKAISVLRLAAEVAGPESEIDRSRALTGLADALKFKFTRSGGQITEEDSLELRQLAGEATNLYREVLESRRRVLGQSHPHTLAAMTNLAAVLQDQGDLSQARALYEHVISEYRTIAGPTHPGTLAAMSNLATILQRQGDSSRARMLSEQVLNVYQDTYGPEHPGTLTAMSQLAAELARQGDVTSAHRLYEELLLKSRKAYGDAHPNTVNTMSNLATVVQLLGDEDTARSYRDLIARYRQLPDNENYTEIASASRYPQIHAHLDESPQSARQPQQPTRSSGDTAVIQVYGRDVEQQTRSLLSWLLNDEQLRRTTAISDAPGITESSLGADLANILVVQFIANGAKQALAIALVSWMRGRRSSTRIVTSLEDGRSIQLESENIIESDPRSLARNLSDFLEPD